MKNKYLKEPIVTINLEGIHTISELLFAFERTSFQSRNLAKCADIFVKMLKDPERPTVFLGLAGAMVPAGMKGIIATMIKKNMVDVIVSTGANTYHDLVEALGEHHYLGSPEVDDGDLYKEQIDRIYDTYADESKFRMFDNMIMSLANEMTKNNVDRLSSQQFLNLLGDFIESNGQDSDKKDSIIWNCWKHDVPIFVPALNDSSLGLALTQHYIGSIDKSLTPLLIDQIQDNYEIFKIKKKSEKSGVIYVGGGVPKNYIQQTAYLQDLFGVPDSGHDYGFQITTDSPQWGGLSGATFKEGLSWGKQKSEGMYVTCHCDATIALPLIVKATLERCKDLASRSKFELPF
jgi:deoxyhypusine synthase